MAIRYKSDVRGQVQKPIYDALIIATKLWEDHFGLDLMVTSLQDSTKHMKDSLHYRGLAADLRSSHLPTLESIAAARKLLKQSLGAQYDVVIEKDHIHMEYDPHHDGGRSYPDGPLMDPPASAPVS